MASSSRDIPQELWEQHKETILRLRFREKLPLDETSVSGRNIMQLMRDEHNFHATVSQYEAQFKEWQASKNLKRRDWEAIFPVYDHLKQQGLEPRGPAVTGENVGLFTVDKDGTRDWHLEIRQPDGQYTEYSAEHERPEVPEAPVSSSLVRRDSENNLFDVMSGQPQAGGQNSLPYNTSLAGLHTPQLTEFLPDFASASNECHWEETNGFSRFFLDQDPLEDLSFSGAVALDPLSFGGCEIDNFAPHISPGPLQSQWTLSSDCIESILQSVPLGPELSHIDHGSLARDILEKMESLVCNSFFEEGPGDAFALISCGTTPISEIHKRIIVSIVNNFAGLSDIPPAVILKMLRIDPTMISCLVNGLRSTDLTIAKPLADNLFRIAIAAGDDEAVDIILTTTTGRMNEIDLNQLVCSFQGGSYTPIALASHLCHFGVVEKLLRFGAKVHVHSSHGVHGCALREILWAYNSSRMAARGSSETIRIVGALLASGAEVSMDLLEQAFGNIELRSSELVEMLVQAVPKERYREFFQRRQNGVSLLSYIAKNYENQSINKIIKNLIRSCQATNCAPARAVDYSDVLSELLAVAILNGDPDLTEYLLGHVQPTFWHLTAAIHSRQLELVDRMLKKGTGTRGIAFYSESKFTPGINIEKNRHARKWFPRNRKPTTPLAEAIRLQNTDLIKRLEDRGALAGIFDGTTLEFKAAALALAEVGDVSYLKRLIKSAPNTYILDLNDPIESAIEAGHNEAVTVMITHLARQGVKYGPSCPVGIQMDARLSTHVFDTVLKKQNRDIVEILLEHGFLPEIEGTSVLCEAVRWGDKRIVKDFLQMGCPFSWTTTTFSSASSPEDKPTSPLGLAISRRDAEVVHLLLEWGSDPSELAAAIRVGDEDVMRLLLRHGAEPADEAAFSAALGSGNHALTFALFKAFSSRYPSGKKGFGLRVLREAITSCNARVLDTLLKLKLDVNCLDHSGTMLFLAIRQTEGGNAETIQIVRQLLDAGADFERAFCGQSALLEAVAANNVEVVRLLLGRGSDINRPARRGLKRTPLQQACELGSFPMVQFLLDNGADVNAPPAMNGGATALQLAAIQGGVRIVRLLLEEGADIHAAPAAVHGRTALEGAAEYGRVSVLDLLLQEGAAGYGVEEIKSAREYAKKQDHRGCKERLKLALFRFGDTGGRRARLTL
ncbi:Ankyrin repeat-containing domain protein [Niveomyces insectorum RCEF 264]|uniref:Ankyrin repeat-containing domain protein n=1 Tax=Niveomyces insectorum RCEF 264 TaxID=1081102 RepID=A0A167WD69_9HYPO|nr:Ankyrin repeat-containing domain protein [Niveomyces insectorum RCEF 264]